LLSLVCIKEVKVNGNILLKIVHGRFSGDDIQFMEKKTTFIKAQGNATKKEN